MAAPPQYGIHPYSHYGYAYGAGTTAAVAAADYTWGANAAQYSQWQTPSAQSAPNPLDQEPDALQSRTLFFGRLPEDVTEDSLRDVVLQHGDLKKVAVYPEKRMAFVEFYDLRHAEAARDALRGSDVLGKRVEVQFSAVKRPDKDGNTGTLYVRPVSTVHVSGNWTDPNSLDAYRELFSKHGDLKKVSANRKRETEKFVEYFDLRDAQKALESLNGYVFNGATLHICFAQNASRTINKNVERSGGSRRTPESYGPVRGSSSGSGGMSRAYASAPYAAPVSSHHPHAVPAIYASGPLTPQHPPPAYVAAVPYAAGPAAYGAYAVPYQPAPYSLYAYQQPQPQTANGYAATQQWASATAPVAAPTAAAVPYAVAPQAASSSATNRSSPGSGAAVSTSYAGTAPTPAAGTTSVAAPRW